MSECSFKTTAHSPVPVFLNSRKQKVNTVMAGYLCMHCVCECVWDPKIGIDFANLMLLFVCQYILSLAVSKEVTRHISTVRYSQNDVIVASCTLESGQRPV